MVRNKDRTGEGTVYIVWPKNLLFDHENHEYAVLIVMEMMQKGNIVKLSCFPIPLKHNDFFYPTGDNPRPLQGDARFDITSMCKRI